MKEIKTYRDLLLSCPVAYKMNAEGKDSQEMAIALYERILELEENIAIYDSFVGKIVQGWIDCREELPKKSGWYLTSYKGCIPRVTFFNEKGFWNREIEPTHWLEGAWPDLTSLY